jgi:hypothetical protein
LQQNSGYARGTKTDQSEDAEEHGKEAANNAETLGKESHPPKQKI